MAWRTIAAKLLAAWASGRTEREFEEEIQIHIGMLAERFRGRGMSDEKAWAAARREFGNRTVLKESRYEMRLFACLETFWQDLQFSARTLGRSKGFATIALLTLALGIGANSAVFSIVNAVLLSPLPYPDANRLVVLWQSLPEVPTNSVTGPDFEDWRKQARSYDGLAAAMPDDFNLTGTQLPRSYGGMQVSANFFSVLGVHPRLGRTFTPEEEHAGADHVAIVSAGMWRGALGASPDAIGRKIVLNGEPFTVIGVMPPKFQFVIEKADVWVPLAIENNNDRHTHALFVVGRLKQGVTIEEARTELTGIAARLAKAYPETDANWTATVISLRDQMTGGVRMAMLVLLAAVGLLLLIACANTANLLLLRAAGRRREIGIRIAIGASAGRIIRQSLAESLLLALLGGALGLLVAWAAVQTVVALNPGSLPRMDEVRMDGTVLWFTFGISCLAGIGFGLLPALQAAREDIHHSLREGAKGTGGGVRGHRTRNTLVGVEVGVSLVLLIGASLLVRSLFALTGGDLGFKPDHLLSMNVRIAEQEYSSEQQEASDFNRVLERLRNLPGVISAAAATNAPSLGWNQGRRFEIKGRPWPAGELHGAGYVSISPSYFRTTGIRLLRGRVFTPADRHGSPEVIIISQAFAKRYFPKQDPLEESIICYSRAFGANRFRPAIARRIVGVVSDVRHLGSLEADASVEMYAPQLQNTLPFTYFLVRTALPPGNLAAAARHAVNRILPSAPVANVASMETLLEASVATPRFNAFLLGTFATIALLLAAIGVYGISAYSVQQRTREVGIRIALGSSQTEVLRLFLIQGIRPALLGALAGLAAALGITRFMASLLHDVSARDPLTFLVIPIVLVLAAGVAAFVPALRATRVDPATALRNE